MVVFWVFQSSVGAKSHIGDHLQPKDTPPPILMWTRLGIEVGGGYVGDYDTWVRNPCDIDQHFSDDTVCQSPGDPVTL